VAEVLEDESQGVTDGVGVVCNQYLHVWAMFSRHHATGLEGSKSGGWKAFLRGFAPKMARKCAGTVRLRSKAGQAARDKGE
jgi:hypothetical protein